MNGACLTVTEFDANRANKGGWFKVWLANETLDKTDLGTCAMLPVFICKNDTNGTYRF